MIKEIIKKIKQRIQKFWKLLVGLFIGVALASTLNNPPEYPEVPVDLPFEQEIIDKIDRGEELTLDEFYLLTKPKGILNRRFNEVRNPEGKIELKDYTPNSLINKLKDLEKK